MKNDLEPVTIETMNRLKGWERQIVLNQYLEWRDKARKQDKLQLRNLNNRIFRKKYVKPIHKITMKVEGVYLVFQYILVKKDFVCYNPFGKDIIVKGGLYSWPSLSL
jgi:hypothetical protein